MAIDPSTAMTRIRTVALAAPLSIPTVTYGVPNSPDNRINAFLTLDRWTLEDGPGGLVRHAIDLGFTFVYRVLGAEQTIETALATKVGLFLTAMLAERRINPPANTTLKSLGWTMAEQYPDFSRAALPRYVVTAAAEYREYPGVIRLFAEESF